MPSVNHTVRHPYKLLWTAWPEDVRDWTRYYEANNINRISRDIVQEFMTIDPERALNKISELQSHLQNVHATEIELTNNIAQQVALYQSSKYRLSAEHLESNYDDHKYYTKLEPNGCRHRKAPKCEDTLRTIGILKCLLDTS